MGNHYFGKQEVLLRKVSEAEVRLPSLLKFPSPAFFFSLVLALGALCDGQRHHMETLLYTDSCRGQ